ncbi:MAG: hypothetical protein H6710_06280 [Myxococcales bacterium]|nr:hypothetical protein [Myxococcales bacterium]MCB9704544.1 hypothetical protein [Myxococcales bacterium]
MRSLLRRTPLLAAAPLLLLAACGGGQPTPAPSTETKAAPTPAPATPAPAGPTAAHGDPSGMPPGHPPVMGAPGGPSEPAGPQNPREVTPTGEVRAETFGGLKIEIPSEWTSRPPKSSMRLAELVLPGPGGDIDLAVYRFPGGAGGVEANINRWKGQFLPPEGKTIDDLTTVTTEERPPLKITRVDIRGTYTAEMTPGAGDRRNDADARMLAAIIEGSGDPYFLKAAGSSQTLDVWAPAFEKALASAAVE